jgi:hypothetical protein
MSNIVPVCHRFPSELKDMLNESAKENGRSASAELVHRLEQSFKSSDNDSDTTLHDKLDVIIKSLNI